MLVAKIGNALLMREGFTFDRFGNTPSTGYAVAVDSFATVESGITAVEIGTADYIGGWIDPSDGRMLIEKVMVFESLRNALAVARAHSQFSIFDLKNGKEITVKS